MFKRICIFFLFFVTLYGYHQIQISEQPRIFLLKDFLTGKECDHIIRVSRPNMIPSKVVDDKNRGETTDYRRSSEGFFIPTNWNDPLLKGIENRIESLTGIPVENGESLHILHYKIGGEYQPHFDYFNPLTAGGADYLRRGGQRIATVLMYLNTPKAGGETIFPKANITIKPQKGDAVLFYNCTPDGTVDPNSFHGGSPVIAGEKWIMTQWIREKAFRKKNI
ncbi:MAG TPA: 2OG-Fe(II) oxygenase [Chlamydiales bacterium]|nr:2OG-Fe(II) oxygenase [Chlamydiales bacterium]